VGAFNCGREEMADKVVFGESAEQVAYKLLYDIATAEGKNLNVEKHADRAYILTTYALCLRAATGKAVAV
jgi:hypothetical protein